MILDIIRLIFISIIVLFSYFFITNFRNDDKQLIELVYNKKCIIKNFDKIIKKHKLIYKVDNLLLKSNILNPLIFHLMPFNINKKIYKRHIVSEVFKFSDGGYTIIDYAYNKDKNKPILYFTNTFGMENKNMTFLQKIIVKLNKSYNCIFIHSRGYKLPINNKTIYLCNIIEDLDEILNYLINKNINNEHFLVGASMGSNSFCNYLCDNNYKNDKIKGFISICNPLDLLNICYNETSSLLNNLIISKIFKQKINKYLQYNFNHNKYIKNNIDFLLDDLDLFYSKLIKPYSKKKYKNFNDFCFNISCINSIENLQTPSLFIFAQDDCVTPVSKSNIEKLKNNKYIFQLHTLYGSHLGYHEDNGNIWLINVIDKFINYINN